MSEVTVTNGNKLIKQKHRECSVDAIVFHMQSTKSTTRTLAINVSIPNLTVARLEQFRSPQLYESRHSDQQT